METGARPKGQTPSEDRQSENEGLPAEEVGSGLPGAEKKTQPLGPL